MLFSTFQTLFNTITKLEQYTLKQYNTTIQYINQFNTALSSLSYTGGTDKIKSAFTYRVDFINKKHTRLCILLETLETCIINKTLEQLVYKPLVKFQNA